MAGDPAGLTASVYRWFWSRGRGPFLPAREGRAVGFTGVRKGGPGCCGLHEEIVVEEDVRDDAAGGRITPRHNHHAHYHAPRAMRDQGTGGRIVNIASTNGQMSEAEFAYYNASKAVIISLTKTMAVELAPYGILVNAVAPGRGLTPLSEPFVGTLSEDALGRISPLKRVGTADEVAAAVSFLCGSGASYITGNTLNVDGGLKAMHPAI